MNNSTLRIARLRWAIRLFIQLRKRDTMLKLISVAAALFMISSPTFASLQEFEDEQRPLWFDAVGEGNYTTLDFTGFPEATTITDEYSPYGVTFSGTNFVSPSIIDPDGWILRIFDGNNIYFDQPINWFAADIAGSIKVELFLDDQLIHTSQIFGAGPTPHFGGLISDEPFNRVFIYDPSDNLAITHNVFFGPPIPSPGALGPFGFVLLLRRRRRR